ncbi:MAG: SGNH/GDSL hydrolase family protein [Anaerolineae bacterium]|nr:SGNH/GDSL hydrolase family protein [Anaerolineae bacterium]
MNKRRSKICLRNLIIHFILGFFGIIGGLVLIEIGLHLTPSEYLDSIIERTSQRRELYRLNPQIGWVLKPNTSSIITTKEGLAIPIRNNSLGLRDSEHAYQKPADTSRILVLGDSFAEAQEVYLEETFHYRLEQCLNQKLPKSVEVINGGVSGYSTTDEYLFYKYEGVKYNPDLILLHFYVGNDFAELRRTGIERLVAAFGGYKFTLTDGHLNRIWISWENPPDETISSFELFLRRNFMFYRILTHPESKIYWAYESNARNIRQWFLPKQESEVPSQPLKWDLYMHVRDFPNNPIVPPEMQEAWIIFQIVINKLNAEVEANGSQLAVIIIPVDYQVKKIARDQALREHPILYDDEFNTEWRIDEPNLTIVSEMKLQSIPVLDLFPYFLAHDEAGGNSLYFSGTNQHLNRDGHKFMSDIMCDWLIRNGAMGLPRPIIEEEGK